MTLIIILLSILIGLMLIAAISIYFLLKGKNPASTIQAIAELQQEKFQTLSLMLHEKMTHEGKEQLKELHSLREEFKLTLADHRQKSTELELDSQKNFHTSLQTAMQDVRQQLTQFLEANTNSIHQRLESLTTQNNEQLQLISGKVESRLAEGFEKTNATFIDVVKRLALIDEAQKKITELSSNVVSLQSILDDKRSRGAFGEVQLSALVSNLMPSNAYSLQHTLSNGKRCDCILFLPEPTGNVVIDAKFPLETYRKLNLAENSSELSMKQLRQQFRQDLKTHIQDIASKYLLPGETADGAMMFIPAEAIFSDIHAHYPDIVEFAYEKRVWFVSPTTMMAILTTARAVLKDADTREQIHVIQKHLGDLSKDFSRFQKRMDGLVKYIDKAREEAEDVNKSAKKITSRFDKIEKLEMIEQNQA